MSTIQTGGTRTLRPPSTLGDVAGGGRIYLDGLGNPERFVRELLEKAGIEVGGGARHDIAVHDRRFYARVARDGALGLGEAYGDGGGARGVGGWYGGGWWDSPAVDEMITRLHLARLPAAIRKNWKYLASVLK